MSTPMFFERGKIQKLSTGVKINHLSLRDEMGIDFEAHLFKTCIYIHIFYKVIYLYLIYVHIHTYTYEHVCLAREER